MAISLFGGGRHSSSWDPFLLESAWDPFEMMEPSPARSFGQGVRAIAGTKVDWLETDKAHVFKADLPGLKREEIKVELEADRILRISGERSKEQVNKGDTWHTVERSHGRFLRKFKLPENAQADAADAKVVDGVLTVTIPKTRTKTLETRNIAIS